MKNKKLKKKTVFIFKQNNMANLTKEQMRRIYGGDGPTGGDHSGQPECGAQTLNNTFYI